MEEEEEKEKEEEKKAESVKQKEVKMATVYLGFFPTAVTQEKLEEAREESIRRIFGSTDTLRFMKSSQNVGTYKGILQKKTEEHCQEGNQYFSQGEWERAITCFSKALNLDPKKVELYEQKAEAFLQLCDFQSAVMHLRKAYSMSPRKENISARLAFILQLQGQCLYEQSAYLEALEAFTHALELQPRNTFFRMRSIACLGALKRYNDCLQMVNEEVAQEKNPDLFVLRARLYEHFGKVTLCFHNLQDAIALEPGHTEALAMLSNLKKEAQKSRDQAVNKAVKGNLKAALLKINRAIDYNPLDANYYLFRGSILRRLKDFNAAIDDYLKAVELSQEEEGSEVRSTAQKQMLLTYNDFAVHCYGKGCYEEAVLLLNKAIKGEKNEKGLYMNRGDCFLKLGELNFAMADYQQALALRPLDPYLQKRIAWLHNEMGLQDFQERRYWQAESHFSCAIENNPREVKYYLHRAKSRMFLQEVMGTKEDLATALLLDPGRAETHTLVHNFFPGEQIHSIVSGKIGDLARALLDRRLAACPGHSAPSNREGLESKGRKSPKDIYIENKDPEMGEEEEEKKKKEKQPDSEEKKLYEKVIACQMKTNKVSQEVKKVLEKRASLESHAVRLDRYPSLPEKVSSKEPYQWKKVSRSTIHF
ncbi:tetratricopeptide repeat protein 16 [Sceloporus undulatus]|uniref:tetratricopeptide repeat protein 16 n=1 Tax=Sceloporus undulatus TaxID=8520 RepID=UPI001C4CD4A1|nr:tetratricopeptide repeat protein 16 [Sceloporus undulatus]